VAVNTANIRCGDLDSALCLITPAAYEQTGSILDSIIKAGHIVSRLRLLTPSKQLLQSFSQASQDAQLVQDLLGPVTALELQLNADSSATRQWNDVIVRTAADSLAAELSCWFAPAKLMSAEVGSTPNVTCCIIKPHAVQSGMRNDHSIMQVTDANLGCKLNGGAVTGQLGAIVQNVLDEGFEIAAMQLFHVCYRCCRRCLG